MADAAAQSVADDLRPPAVFSVGVTGHRSIGVEGEPAGQVAASFEAVFARLAEAFRNTSVENAGYFSQSRPTLRVVCMGADGADLLGARAARAGGAEIALVLPFAADEYAKDFASAASAALFSEISAAGVSRFQLPGTRAEGPRAYERANEVILANIDLLIAVWDGKRANGRAGTGDVVQAAASSGIPTIVIDPQRPNGPALLLRPSDAALERPIAIDLQRRPLDADLRPLIRSLVCPPPSSQRRRGFVDLLVDRARPSNWRFEYPMLLKLFGVARTKRPGTVAPSPKAGNPPHGSVPGSPIADGEGAAQLARLRETTQQIDTLAGYYGQLIRSSAVSRFLLIVVVAFLSGLVGILFPRLFGVSLIFQLAVNAVVLIDGTIGGRRRWQERWLDYRSLAERLRVLRFLHPLGIGPVAPVSSLLTRRASWTDWYVVRTARGLGAPTGIVGMVELSAAAEHLVGVEISAQVAYHRRTFRQLGKLERRLAVAAKAALTAAVVVGGALAISAYLAGGVDAVGWRPIANVLLAALPAAMSAFNGIRADADLVRLVERSAGTTAALSRLGRAVAAAPLSYDRLALAATRAAAIMANELSEWRFVFESRRARTKRRRGIRR